MTGPSTSGRGWAVWTAGLVVVIAAGAATAHGLYVVALGSGTPAGIAWLYPVITDGLALVAYAATSRLTGGGRRYAWAVVVLAAGLSGLAQATYLAGALPPSPAPAVGPGGVGATGEVVAAAPPVLRFGVGAWPAIAAAIAAHLLFLIGTGPGRGGEMARGGSVGAGVPAGAAPAVPGRVVPAAVPSVVPFIVPPGVPSRASHSVRSPAVAPPPGPPVGSAGAGSEVERDGMSQAERARSVAQELAERTGALPTVRELAEASGVARGTAHRALTALRAPTNGHRPATEPARDEPGPAQGAFWEPEKP